MKKMSNILPPIPDIKPPLPRPIWMEPQSRKEGSVICMLNRCSTSNHDGLLYTAKSNTSTAANRLNGISKRRVDFCDEIGKISAVKPNITKILMILLPSTLVMAISVLPCPTATMFTTNSGILVPNATTVRPMTISLTPYFFAKAEAPSTRKSAPLMSAAQPKIMSGIATQKPPVLSQLFKNSNIVISLERFAVRS